MMKKWWWPGWRLDGMLATTGGWGGVPPYCTGHTPTPPRRLIPGAPIALRKASLSQVSSRQFSSFWRHSRTKHVFFRFRRVEFSGPDPPRESDTFPLFSILVHLAHSCRKKSILGAHFGFFMVHLRRNLEATWPQLRPSWPQLGEKFPPKSDLDSKKGAQDPPRPSQTTIFFNFSTLSLIFDPSRPHFLVSLRGVFPCRKGGGVNPSSREVGGNGVEWMLGWEFHEGSRPPVARGWWD